MDSELTYFGTTEDGLHVRLTVNSDDNRATIQTRATDSVEWSPATELEKAPLEVPC